MSSRLQVSPFSLRDTMECGQFFRFTQVGGTYVVQTGGRIFSLWQKKDTLYYDGVEEAFLIRFFRLDEDLDGILREIDRDPFSGRDLPGPQVDPAGSLGMLDLLSLLFR
jgi:hypothetical protein